MMVMVGLRLMKSKLREELLKDLLRIVTRETHKLPEILANNFDLFKEQIVKFIQEEYQKPKADYRLLCGCFLIIWRVSRDYPIVGDKTFRKLYPLLNKGLQDKRISIKRLATLSILNILCNIYPRYYFCKLSSNKDNLKEVDAEIRRLKKSIKSSIFLEIFYSLYPRQVDRQTVCQKAGIKEDVLAEVARCMLG